MFSRAERRKERKKERKKQIIIKYSPSIFEINLRYCEILTVKNWISINTPPMLSLRNSVKIHAQMLNFPQSYTVTRNKSGMRYAITVSRLISLTYFLPH